MEADKCRKLEDGLNDNIRLHVTSHQYTDSPGLWHLPLMWRESEVMSSPGGTDNTRGVLDRASLVHLLLIVRGLGGLRTRPRVEARGRDPGLLQEEELSLVYQLVVLRVLQYRDQPQCRYVHTVGGATEKNADC